MTFTSISFAIFLPLAILFYWICPSKYRWIFLLAVSYYFYMSISVPFVLLLLFTTALSYVCALLMERSQTAHHKKMVLTCGTLLLLGILFTFKYLSFFLTRISAVASAFAIPLQAPTIKLLLPLGISFYTFQTLGYLFDVYREKIKAETHFGYYALFVSFFPQILSGPIGRADKLLPQLKETHQFNYSRTTHGLKLMAWGYFKKLAVAGLAGGVVDSVYNSLQAYIGLVLIVATVLFAIQIYCDFSGYTDIALGVAELFGIDLINNFKSPYFSTSIRDFWSRWHISLSTWFRDYLYIPLGGSRCGKLRRNLNLILTFLASGLWHGASWNFVIWGGIHGVLQSIESTFFKGKKFPRILVFALVCVTWVFFRANSLTDSIYVFQNAFVGITDPLWYLKILVISLNMSYLKMLWIALPIILLVIYDYASLKTDVIAAISKQKAWVRWPVYISLLVVILLFSQKGVATDFIYSQF